MSRLPFMSQMVCLTAKASSVQLQKWCGNNAGSLGIPTDETQIATDLYTGLQNFFATYTELQNRPLFITGESYAGKYVPAIGELPGVAVPHG